MRDETPTTEIASRPNSPTGYDGGEITYESFKGSRQVKGLSGASTLNEVLDKFGLKPDDRVSRREQIIMYRKVESAFEQRIAALVRLRRYEEAKARRQTLRALREAFEGLQKDEERLHHKEQLRRFEQGRKHVWARLGSDHIREEARVAAMCVRHEEYLGRKHRYQWENCERAIAGAIEPRIKFSTRLHYLKNAEKSLVRLFQYDDAKNVANMISKLEPSELQEHRHKFRRSLQLRREKLQANQDVEIQRLCECTTALRWKSIRRRDGERTLLNQRLKNLLWDMSHCHAMEGQHTVEMSLRPSALLQKRANYQYSGSGLRGQQLLNSLNKGKMAKDAIYVATLTDIHDFARPQPGTEVLG